MTSRRNNLVILGLVVVLLGVAAYLIFLRGGGVTETTRLGLDLQGGVSAQLQGSQTGGGNVTREEMERAADLIRERIDDLESGSGRIGVTEPDVRVQGEDQMIVQIPGIENPDEVIEIIGSTAQLGFYQVLATEAQQAVPPSEVPDAREDIGENLREEDAFEDGGAKVLFEESPSPTGGGTYVAGYVVGARPDLTGDALRPNGASADFGTAGDRQVTLQLTTEGARQFGDLTQSIVNESLTSGEVGLLAIALDDEVYSAPTVTESIPNGLVSISNEAAGGLPEDEAERLVTVLNTGALPVSMEVISQDTVGPSLGLSSLRSALLAAVVGFGIVLVLLAVIYRALGLVADLALLAYAFLLWGIVVAVPITLTLPGIAGIVLSIGVAADANVVIFERIKEEVRRGKTPRAAVAAGYEKGFRAILDGNVTTLITAVILYGLSTGSVRAFAVLLIIGVLLSMFTAVLVTRALLGLISGRGTTLSPTLMGVAKNEVGQQPAAASARVR